MDPNLLFILYTEVTDFFIIVCLLAENVSDLQMFIVTTVEFNFLNITPYKKNILFPGFAGIV